MMESGRALVALAGVGLVNVALAVAEVPGGRECPPPKPTSVEALFAPCLVVAKADHPLGPEAVPPPWPAPVPLPPVIPKPTTGQRLLVIVQLSQWKSRSRARFRPAERSAHIENSGALCVMFGRGKGRPSARGRSVRSPATAGRQAFSLGRKVAGSRLARLSPSRSRSWLVRMMPAVKPNMGYT